MDAEDVARDRDIQLLSGEYSDLLSINTDLEFVVAAARRYASVVDTADTDGVERRAFWWSAAVAYRRCFNGGKGSGFIKRTRLTVPASAADALNEAEKSVHDRTLAAANQHVAHGVDKTLEQIPVSLLFRTGTPHIEIAGLAHLGALYLGPPPSEALSLADIAERLIAAIGTEIERKRSQLLALAATLASKEVKG